MVKGSGFQFGQFLLVLHYVALKLIAFVVYVIVSHWLKKNLKALYLSCEQHNGINVIIVILCYLATNAFW